MVFWPSRHLDFWPSGLLAIRPSDHLVIQTSGHLIIRSSDHPVIPPSGYLGHPDFWPSDHPTIWSSGHLVIRSSDYPVFWPSGHLVFWPSQLLAICSCGYQCDSGQIFALNLNAWPPSYVYITWSNTVATSTPFLRIAAKTFFMSCVQTCREKR